MQALHQPDAIKKLKEFPKIKRNKNNSKKSRKYPKLWKFIENSY
jgi:hypothetical protein